MPVAKKSLVYEEKIKCPHCSKKIIIQKYKEVLTEPVKGEYAETIKVDKDFQRTLK